MANKSNSKDTALPKKAAGKPVSKAMLKSTRPVPLTLDAAVAKTKRLPKSDGRGSAPVKGSNGSAPAKSRTAPANRAQPKSVSREEIALRAYFLGINRRNQGLAGDEHQDWLDAEIQLSAGV